MYSCDCTVQWQTRASFSVHRQTEQPASCAASDIDFLVRENMSQRLPHRRATSFSKHLRAFGRHLRPGNPSAWRSVAERGLQTTLEGKQSRRSGQALPNRRKETRFKATVRFE